MLCVLIRIASRGNSNEYTQHTWAAFIEDEKNIPKLYTFASWPGAIINTQWLKLPMSRITFHGPKDVRAIEVQLYMHFTYVKSKSTVSIFFFFFFFFQNSFS